MLRADPRPWLHRARWRTTLWWRSGSIRQRFRRKLVVFSLPVALLLIAAMAKITTVMLVGSSAVDDFARHDIDALRSDLDTLSTFNVIEPQKLTFAQGDLAVLEGRLDDAEHSFTTALDAVDAADSCPVRINLELVRETQGDLAARGGDKAGAEQRYSSALGAVKDAPPQCFSGNTDPNPDRRHVREDAAARLQAKIDSLHRPPPPPSSTATPTPTAPSPSLAPTTLPGVPPPGAGAPPTAAPSPPPPPPGSGPGDAPVFGPGGGDGGDGGPGALNDVDPDRLASSGNSPAPGHRLGTGDPLDKLQDALGNADATGSSRDAG